MKNHHDVVRHAMGIYDVPQYHQGEANQVEVGQGRIEPDVRERVSGQELACADNHERNDHDVSSHEIGIHDDCQHRKGETKPIGIDSGSPQRPGGQWQKIRDEAQSGCPRDSEVDETLPTEAKEYWRPSYMFHWLRCIGGSTEDAYKHFEQYKGRESYEELQLQPPTPLQRDGERDGCSEWTFMSDYDNFGVALEESQDTIETKMAHDHNHREQKMGLCGRKDTWRHAQQAYFVDSWSTIDLEGTREQQVGRSHATTTKTINCFVRGSKPKKFEGRMEFEDGDSDSEEEQMVCSMTGQSWEPLFFQW